MQGDFYSVMFWLEVGILSLPTFTLFFGRKFYDSRWLFVSALCMIGGSALWRLNYSIIMFEPGMGYDYFPSAEELLISIGFISIEICAYIFIVRLFPVLPVFKEVQEENNIQHGVKA